MRRTSTVFVISPDYPPTMGGIQLLVDRVISAFEEVTPVVITERAEGSDNIDVQRSFRIVRVPRILGVRILTNLAINIRAIGIGLLAPPDVCLCMHIVTSPAALLLRRWRGTPVVLYLFAKEIGVRPSLAHFAVRRADRVIVISHYTRDLALAVGADPARMILISPGVDVPAVAKDPPAKHPIPTVLTVSRLEDRYKGHDVVLRAMPLVRAKLKDAQWRVVGDGPLRPNLEARAHALGLGEAVTFLGQLSDDQRDEEFMRADVFCMVSRLPATGLAGEGFGIVYLEAGARLLPSVAANEGGGADAVLDGQTGVQVDPEDHVGLAEVLVSLLSDRRYAARLGRAGRDHAAELQWDVIARSVEAEILALTG